VVISYDVIPYKIHYLQEEMDYGFKISNK